MGRQVAPPDVTLLTTQVEGGSGGGSYFLSLKTSAGGHRCSHFTQCVFHAAQAQGVIWVSSFVIVL